MPRDLESRAGAKFPGEHGESAPRYAHRCHAPGCVQTWYGAGVAMESDYCSEHIGDYPTHKLVTEPSVSLRRCEVHVNRDKWQVLFKSAARGLTASHIYIDGRDAWQAVSDWIKFGMPPE